MPASLINTAGLRCLLLAGSLSAVAGVPLMGSPPPVITVTDCFRPHVDPDDHWDLATVFALAYQRNIDLKAIVCDWPPAIKKPFRSPDVGSVALMNYITGLAVPMAVGSPEGMKSLTDTQPGADQSDHQGVNLIIRILRESASPVVIHVLGWCNDVALAGRKEPDLFRRKCAGIYLNAGMGSQHWQESPQIGYNEKLNPISYAAMFDLPCPVYWMPCFDDLEWFVAFRKENKFPASVVREFGTHFWFRHDAIIPHLSKRMKNYFAFMYGRHESSNWLHYANVETDEKLLDKLGPQYRQMWCIAGFIHSAGKTVLPDGRIVALEKAGNDAVFAFEGVSVTCDESGRTRWSLNKEARERFIFRVRNIERYEAAMIEAMKNLLLSLP